MRKSTFCICKKEADHLRESRAADQRLCFCYIVNVQSLYFIKPKFQASSHLVAVQFGLCWTWLETPDRFSPDVAQISLLKQGYHYHKLRKAFTKFYR